VRAGKNAGKLNGNAIWWITFERVRERCNTRVVTRPEVRSAYLPD